METIATIGYAGGCESARVKVNSDGTAVVEFYCVNERGEMDYRNPATLNKVFPTPRDAVHYILEIRLQW